MGATVAAGLLLTGCAGSVAITDARPDAAARPVCAAMMADLPAHVLDQSRRTVTPGALSAAWGKPAITLRCGVAKPAGLVPSSQCFEVNGVGWFAEEAKNGYFFTTIGRPAFVEVRVPATYAPEANALVDLAATVSAHDPVQSPCR